MMRIIISVEGHKNAIILMGIEKKDKQMFKVLYYASEKRTIGRSSDFIEAFA